jgi:hypothetical protein
MASPCSSLPLVVERTERSDLLSGASRMEASSFSFKASMLGEESVFGVAIGPGVLPLAILLMYCYSSVCWSVDRICNFKLV